MWRNSSAAAVLLVWSVWAVVLGSPVFKSPLGAGHMSVLASHFLRGKYPTASLLGVKWGKKVGGQLWTARRKLLFKLSVFRMVLLPSSMPVFCFPENTPPVYREGTDSWLLRVQHRFCFLNKLPARPLLFKPPSPPLPKIPVLPIFWAFWGLRSVNWVALVSPHHKFRVQCASDRWVRHCLPTYFLAFKILLL